MERVTRRGRLLPLWGLIATAAVAAGSVALRYGWTVNATRSGVLVLLVSAAAYTDLRRGTIPNGLCGIGVLCGLAFALGSGLDALVAAVGAGFATGLVLLGVRAFGHLVVGQPGMGYGDVKLGVVLGLFLGWGSLWALYLATVVGGVFGVVGIVSGLVERRQRIPFAPFIGVGVLFHLFVLPLERMLSWL